MNPTSALAIQTVRWVQARRLSVTIAVTRAPVIDGGILFVPLPSGQSVPLDISTGRSRRSARGRHSWVQPILDEPERCRARLQTTMNAMVGARAQFFRFCLVGGSGYLVNLTVYWALLTAGLHYLAAAAISFVVAAVNNFLWNRSWTFAARTEQWLGQCLRALLVSGLSLGLNQIFLLALVGVGAGHLVAQASAIVLVTPFSFAANRLWAFAGGPEDEAAAQQLARA